MESLVLSFLVLFALPPQAEVLKYLPDRDLVGISVGSADGVKEGDLIAVWRKLEKVAICRVVKVGGRVSFCRIVQRKSGTQPQDGDRILAASNVTPTPAPRVQEEDEPEPPPKETNDTESPKTTAQPEDAGPARTPDPVKTTPAASAPGAGGVAVPKPVTPPKTPSHAPRTEEVLAVGVAGREILVSSTEGLYVITGGAVRHDESALPHQLLRFVTWGDTVWAETHGGVLLREKNSWRRFSWSRKLNMNIPAFARVTTHGENAWGSFGPHLLVWDKDAIALTMVDGKSVPYRGTWVQLGKPLEAEVESIYAIDEKRLVIATNAGELLVKEGSRVTPLVKLALGEGDPLLLEIVMDHKGTPWGLYFAGDGGLFSLDSNGFRKVPRGEPSAASPALPPGRLLRLVRDARKRVVVLHQTEGVFRYSFDTWNRVGSKPAENAVDIAIRGNEILLLTKRRLLSLAGDEERELLYLEQAELTERQSK